MSLSVRRHPPVAASEGIVATAQHLRNGGREQGVPRWRNRMDESVMQPSSMNSDGEKRPFH